MSKWNLIIDVAECHNCHNCVVAAKDEFVGNEFPGYSAPHPAQGPGVIRIERQVRGQGHHVDAAYLPRLCNHCDDAPCVKAGRGAVKKRDDGIVIFDPVACRGRRDLVDACPYGAVVWNEERQLPQTWFFDAHLLDSGWKEPRCVTVCPTRALQAVKTDDADMAARAQAQGLRPLRPELGTRPRVYYRHLARIDSVFVAGSVVRTAAAGAECVEGAKVELLRDGQLLASAVSDTFGDFRLDGLAAATGPCELKVTHATHGRASVPVALAEVSVVLGDLRLAAS
jgi:Fe-S-cluster-containing dehydrogenase component